MSATRVEASPIRPDAARITRVEVRTFQVKLPCVEGAQGECAGYLVHDGTAGLERGILRDLHMEYRHRCDTCGRGVWVTEKFPQIAYEERKEVINVTLDVDDLQ